MRTQRFVVVGVVIALVIAGGILPGAAQLPLAPVSASGQTVTPAFEGWYENPDGTYSLSFGYFNRNSEEVLEIPIGPNNFIEPGDLNQGQPTRFHQIDLDVLLQSPPIPYHAETERWIDEVLRN
ncbi:MAG: hypothetical protein IID06_01425 [Gemmatimonadetes bacterium]|nr:hypothetical protein [Gemmatimonadota bacterium]